MRAVMSSMFVLWMITFIGVFLRQHWTIAAVVVTLVWTGAAEPS